MRATQLLKIPTAIGMTICRVCGMIRLGGSDRSPTTGAANPALSDASSSVSRHLTGNGGAWVGPFNKNHPG